MEDSVHHFYFLVAFPADILFQLVSCDSRNRFCVYGIEGFCSCKLNELEGSFGSDSG